MDPTKCIGLEKARKSRHIKKETHRIPYSTWRVSQFSIARFYGGVTINEKRYVLDPEELKKFEEDPDITEVFPDLVCYE